MLKWFNVFVFILISFQSKAGLIFTKANERILLGKNLEVLQPGKEIGFAEAIKSSHFVPCNSDAPNMGISANSIWLRFTITNQTEIDKLLLEVAYPILDEVELFIPGSNKHYSSVSLGEIMEFNKRIYQYPNYIFDLDIASNSTQTYYLRIKSTEQIILPISVNRPTALWQNINLENLITGIYLGVVLIMVLYNLFVYFSVRDRSYFYYVIYVLFAGLTQIGIKGYTFQYLWPNSSAFAQKSVILFACISGGAAVMFAQKFLSTKKNAPKSNIALIILIVLFLLAFAVTSIGMGILGFQLMQVTTTLTIVVLFVLCAILIKGSRPAKFFFIAWSVLLIGAIIFLLKDYGILPYNTLTSYSVQTASAIEMCLLSFGLADRINTLKREKEASQAEALRSLQENERIVREQNVVLELKVNERTYELKETNEELNNTLEYLKETQSQLVESEKMASLGQLTAGIAHEINNPINFVTANINPLKRNISIMFDALAAFENLGVSDLPLIDKKRKINEYREEMDFDYLTIETNQLIKGIKEGATRTAEIVKSLKIFSRLDEDDLKRADINEGLSSTMVIANNLLNGKINVVREFGELPLIECYAGKLNQVFLNIISNAIYAIQKKFGDENGGEISIITTYDENNIYVKIADNGIGMDANTQKKVFEPFFTTKEVGEGTGLGMSIAYNTIKKHNGKILLTSVLGVGTEFTLEIPQVFSTRSVEQI